MKNSGELKQGMSETGNFSIIPISFRMQKLKPGIASFRQFLKRKILSTFHSKIICFAINDTWPFNKPHYLLQNLADGGSWGGQKGVDTSLLPLKYQIDYVRYYLQRKGYSQH